MKKSALWSHEVSPGSAFASPAAGYDESDDSRFDSEIVFDEDFAADGESADSASESPSTGEMELEDRASLRRVAGLSTELSDITEVEYRQLRLERVVLVGVWTEGDAAHAE